MYPETTDLKLTKLRTATINALFRNDIYTVGEVRRVPDRLLMRMPWIGRKSIAEIRCILGDHIEPR